MTISKLKTVLKSCFFSAAVLTVPQGAHEARIKAPVIQKIEISAPPPQQTAQDTSFLVWLEGVRKEALAKGISAKTVAIALPNTLHPFKSVIKSDRHQPEKMITLAHYLRIVASNKKIDTGAVRFSAEHGLLEKVSAAYGGVPPQIITALWGIESAYGSGMGSFSEIQALATLAYDPRRAHYFRKELFAALEILDKGDISPAKFKGSWAGAMGQVQFMPSSYLRLAQDFDGDGKRDIWHDHADVFASAANYLHQSGWKKNETWGCAVNVPKNLDRDLVGLKHRHTLAFWRSHGLRLEDGGVISSKGASATASVLQPDGPDAPAFLVYDNFRVILTWNNSSYFATAAGVLADKISHKAAEQKHLAR